MTIDIATIVPVVNLDPTRHGHHDVLASVLDMFVALSADGRDVNARLAHCVAVQLLHCRCEEGRLIRLWARERVTGRHDSNTPVAVVAGRGVCELRGESPRRVGKRHPLFRSPVAKTLRGGTKYLPSSRLVAVSSDVVLTLAGMRAMLPAVLASESGKV